MSKGNYVKIDLKSVKTDATKTIALLNNKLSGRKSNQRHIVVFLGEEHRNAVDQAVTRAMLDRPPLVSGNAAENRVIFERLLDDVYVRNPDYFGSVRTEAQEARTPTARSKIIADMIQDAFEDHDIRVVYLPCGSAHAEEIFKALDKRSKVRFTYIAKMSSTD